MKRSILVILLFWMFPNPGWSLELCSTKEIQELDPKPPIKRNFLGKVGPYLQSVDLHRAVIEWNEEQPTSPTYVVKSGDKTLEGKIKETKTHHQLFVCGLEPFHQVKYQIDGKSFYEFMTLSSPTESKFRFAVLGDFGWDGPHLDAIVKQIDTFKPHWVLTTGDNVYQSGTHEEFLKNVFEPLASIFPKYPFYPTLGNHDCETDNCGPYLEIFTLPHNNPQLTERYYSFDAGPIHFVMLDSASANDSLSNPDSLQVKWLKADLAATHQSWKILVFHHPPYTSEKHHSSNLKIREVLEPLQSAYGVDLVLTGHAHTYERSHPQNGVVFFVTGGGGRSIRDVKNHPEPFSAVAQKRYHFLGLTFANQTLSLQAIDEEGKVFDAWSKSKP